MGTQQGLPGETLQFLERTCFRVRVLTAVYGARATRTSYKLFLHIFILAVTVPGRYYSP